MALTWQESKLAESDSNDGTGVYIFVFDGTPNRLIYVGTALEKGSRLAGMNTTRSSKKGAGPYSRPPKQWIYIS